MLTALWTIPPATARTGALLRAVLGAGMYPLVGSVVPPQQGGCGGRDAGKLTLSTLRGEKARGVAAAARPLLSPSHHPIFGRPRLAELRCPTRPFQQVKVHPTSLAGGKSGGAHGGHGRDDDDDAPRGGPPKILAFEEMVRGDATTCGRTDWTGLA